MTPFLNAVSNQLARGQAVVLNPDTDEARAIAWALGEIERLNAALGDATVEKAAAVNRAGELANELAFYANPATWLRVPTATLAAADKGERARLALQKFQGA